MEYFQVGNPTKPLLLRFDTSNRFKVIQSSPHPLVRYCKLGANTYHHNTFCAHVYTSAAHLAFSDHYGLVLTPDVIWQCIIQAFTTHIKQVSSGGVCGVLEGSTCAHMMAGYQEIQATVIWKK